MYASTGFLNSEVSNTAPTARMTRAPINSATNSNAASNKTSKSISRRAISSSRINSRMGSLLLYTWKRSRLSDRANQCLVKYGAPIADCPHLFSAINLLLRAQFFHHRLQQLLGVRQLHRNHPQIHRRLFSVTAVSCLLFLEVEGSLLSVNRPIGLSKRAFRSVTSKCSE